MALIECPDCHKEISSDVKACPHCGCSESLPIYSGNKPVLMRHMLLAIVITILVSIVTFYSFDIILYSLVIVGVLVLLIPLLTKILARVW